MLKVNNLQYKYPGQANFALDGVDFVVQPGEIVVIVGNNGSGKSTLGRLLAGITQPRAGRILVDELDLIQQPEPARTKLGIVFQNPEHQIIFSRFRDEVAYMLPDLSSAELDQRIHEALKAVDMVDFLERNLYDLSFGQKQRLVIAEMLTKQPKYLILDEPTATIDSWNKSKVYQIIRKLKSAGCGVICVTNLADEILLADRTLILAKGKIVADIPRAELIAQAATFAKYHVKLPQMLELLIKLADQGIKLKLADYTLDELVNQLSGRIYHA